MAVKKFEMPDGTPLTIYKRRSSRSVRLSISAAGDVRVSIPLWMPYSAGVVFAQSRAAWISGQREVPQQMLEGQPIGKNHTLHFRVSAKSVKTTSRISDWQVIVTHSLTTAVSSSTVQKVAEKAAIRALRQEATALLPKRLRQLAVENGFTYADVSIKQLTSRWGSCDSKQHIALNLFLMQLPWDLIDYVLLHELVHTEHMHHGEDFWTALERVVPGAKKFRSEIRKHKPVVVR